MEETKTLGFYDEDSELVLCRDCAPTAGEARRRIAEEAPDFVYEGAQIREVRGESAAELLGEGDELLCDSCGEVVLRRA